MAKGDIVLITFPFTDLTGSKLRPAVVLADTSIDFTVCFITTQIGGRNLPIFCFLQIVITDLESNPLSEQVKLQPRIKHWQRGS